MLFFFYISSVYNGEDVCIVIFANTMTLALLSVGVVIFWIFPNFPKIGYKIREIFIIFSYILLVNLCKVCTFSDVFSIFDSSSDTYSIFDVSADAFFHFYASFESVHTSFSLLYKSIIAGKDLLKS